MSQSPISYQPHTSLDRREVGTHLEESVDGILGGNVTVQLDLIEDTPLSQSIFYRDTQRRSYCINSNEHPALTGLLDRVLPRFLTDISKENKGVGKAYVLTVTECCNEEGITKWNGAEQSDLPEYYPKPMVDHLTPQTPECTSTGISTTTEICVSEVFAQFIGLLDTVAYVRTHPQINHSVLDQYPETINGGESHLKPPKEAISQFSNECESFLLETPPGWRLRWILEVITDDPKPIAKIASAANVPLPEARLTIELLHHWGIVNQNVNTVRADTYELAISYLDWRDEENKNKEFIAEREYLAVKKSVSELIQTPYEILTSGWY